MKKLHQLVDDAIKEEKLIINKLQHPPEELILKGQKLSDKVAQFGGSWKFIILFGFILAVWILYNVLVGETSEFDPYPFILMNLILSCLAALQAPIIMMSQNRQEDKDRKRAEDDYLINLKSEIEIRNLHQKINLLMEEQIDKLMKTQEMQIKLLQQLLKKDHQEQLKEIT
ncbi:DUF1003 domain-containing protein [Solitalea sp. MAHUQ-68]|uniref:DUF1003 domain-containing protein n=1 Tax=Solitalea agri TaxID=2953739 RepID=A0A9X2EYR0_9SPHI|nr:DUF1003 domain-containing protein [Solitalea agri]MCO4291464.1 DUF1003 domain-containing protein [Solitalea agri]